MPIHRLARNRLRREGPGKRLQTTEVVNEAYLQLVRQRHVRWQSRAHPTHEYVVLGTKRAGTMEEELLAAAANGFRLVGQSHYKSPSSEIVAILFDLPEMVAILERPLRD